MLSAVSTKSEVQIECSTSELSAFGGQRRFDLSPQQDLQPEDHLKEQAISPDGNLFNGEVFDRGDRNDQSVPDPATFQIPDALVSRRIERDGNAENGSELGDDDPTDPIHAGVGHPLRTDG
jgi:hypothetical protein